MAKSLPMETALREKGQGQVKQSRMFVEGDLEDRKPELGKQGKERDLNGKGGKKRKKDPKGKESG